MEHNIIKVKTGFKAFVQHHTACNNINKRLRQYLDDGKVYKFEEGEEAIFHFNEQDLPFVKATLNTFGVLET